VGRFCLPLDTAAIGYGHRPDYVAAVHVDSSDLLIGYRDAVYEQTIRFVRTLTDEGLARIVDRSWNAPVSLAVRFGQCHH
jgi:hypothetical protein